MGEWLERHRVYVAFALTVAVAMGLLVLWINRPQSHPIVISTPVPTATPTVALTPTPAPLRVYVTGAVNEPDVYILSPGSIVKDAVLAAGGGTDDADLNRVNLALQVYDQQQVYVPRKGEETSPIALPTEPSLPASAAAKVNINSASSEELDALPGIGPAIAQRVVDYRTENGPFATTEDIMKVKGIGPATFAELEDWITVK